MNYLSDTLAFIAEESSKHLGVHKGSHAATQAHLEGLFRVTEKATNSELANLKRLHLIGVIAAAIGLVLIVIACYMVLINKASAAALPAIPGLLSEIVPVVILRQIEATRKSLGRLLPSHESVLRAMLLLECAAKSPEIARMMAEQIGGSSPVGAKPTEAP